MARPLKTDRPVEKNISLPRSLVVAVELGLYSELEGKIPFGAWQKYIVRLVEADMATVAQHQIAAQRGGGAA